MGLGCEGVATFPLDVAPDAWGRIWMRRCGQVLGPLLLQELQRVAEPEIVDERWPINLQHPRRPGMLAGRCKPRRRRRDGRLKKWSRRSSPIQEIGYS
jgi:hypothetical protein